MIFLISIILAALLIGLCAKPLKQHPAPFYIAAVAISLAVLGCTVGRVAFPEWFQNWVWPLFSRSAFATALWAAVMWAGALPNGSRLMKRLMPIRGELSIIAAILTLGHNAAYGRTYFRFLFTQPSRLRTSHLLASICSIIMLCIMLPLFVTSFKSVHRKMNGASWKKLQRLAYGFYALLYLHVMLLTVPNALAGRSGYTLNVLVYSVVFLGYGLCRILKALALRSNHAKLLFHWQRFALTGALAISLCLTGAVHSTALSNTAQAVESSEPTVETINDTSDVKTEQPASISLDSDMPAESTDTISESEAPAPVEEESPEPADQAPESASTQNEVSASEQVSGTTQTPAVSPTPTTSASPEAVAVPTVEPEPIPESEPVRTYKSGSFSGTGEGYDGPITVSVTIQDDVITAISVTSFFDDDPYWSDGKAVIDHILSAQDPDVDAVSGATTSSGGIIQAVKAALSSAKNEN